MEVPAYHSELLSALGMHMAEPLLARAGLQRDLVQDSPTFLRWLDDALPRACSAVEAWLGSITAPEGGSATLQDNSSSSSSRNTTATATCSSQNSGSGAAVISERGGNSRSNTSDSSSTSGSGNRNQQQQQQEQQQPQQVLPSWLLPLQRTLMEVAALWPGLDAEALYTCMSCMKQLSPRPDVITAIFERDPLVAAAAAEQLAHPALQLLGPLVLHVVSSSPQPADGGQPVTADGSQQQQKEEEEEEERKHQAISHMSLLEHCHCQFAQVLDAGKSRLSMDLWKSESGHYQGHGLVAKERVCWIFK